jgi:hypothetical protein
MDWRGGQEAGAVSKTRRWQNAAVKTSGSTTEVI